MAVISSAVALSSQEAVERAAAYDQLLFELRDRLAWARAGGGEKMVARHRARNKIPVRERIDLLIDPGTGFLELSPLAGWGLYDGRLAAAGIVTGIGTVRRTVCMIIAN